jgi:hypothetical protein
MYDEIQSKIAKRRNLLTKIADQLTEHSWIGLKMTKVSNFHASFNFSRLLTSIKHQLPASIV